jgi:hypothetical protein
MRYLVAVLLLPPFLRADDPSPPLNAPRVANAERLLRLFEAKILSARTARFVFEVKMKGNGEEVTGKGSLAIDSGDKFCLEVEVALGKVTQKCKALSDGTKMKVLASDDGAEPQVQERPTPRNLRALLARLISRGGVAAVGFFAEQGLPEAEPSGDNSLFAVTDLALLGMETVRSRKAAVLRHQVKVIGNNPTTVTLWLDCRTHLPLKRVFTPSDEGFEVTEIYRHIESGGELDAKLFVLPK